ncbi:amino acid decarboxylase [Alicyclobacillus sp. SO9]|nr:amino acid decarboxylase [Alicyclobacillus sp. SO9]
MDVRQLIMQGHHPRGEILQVVDTAPPNTVVEIHVPHRTQPLINALEGMGLNVVVNQMGAAHVRLMAVKM